MRGNVIETVMGAVVLVVAAVFLFFAYSTSQLRAVQGYELTAEFDQNLAELKAPEVREQIETAMASRGRVTPRPKAGA